MKSKEKTCCIASSTFASFSSSVFLPRLASRTINDGARVGRKRVFLFLA